MTISDKIRIYELSRDLNLENKDILDAAQKLSISVKSHSSSISAEEAKKIKNLINKKNSDKKILSIKKPLTKKDNYKQNKENESPVISSMKEKPTRDNSNKKPLLMKPLNKPDSQKIISNKPINHNKPTITNNSQSQANLTNQNLNSKTSQNLKNDKKTFRNNTTPPIKSPSKPPIQLIAKPKNINSNVKSNDSSRNISSSGEKRQLSNKPDQNPNKPKTKNINNRMSPPELVGAPIRRDRTNQRIISKTFLLNKLPPTDLFRLIDLVCPIGLV